MPVTDGEQRRVDVPTEHGGRPQQRPARLGEAADAGAHDVAHGRGHAQRGGARPRQLADEERVAARTAGDRGDDVGVGPPAHPIGERGGDGDGVPARELDHHPTRRRIELSGADGGDDQQPGARHLPGHVGEQRQGVGVGPLHVVEDEDEPGVLGDRGEEARDGVEEREPVARRARRAARERAARPHRGRPGRGRPIRPDIASQDRRIRRHGQYAGAPSAAVQPPHSTGTARARQRGELLGEPGLADPRLPGDHRETGPAVERRVEQRDELGQLVARPTNRGSTERNRTRSTWFPRSQLVRRSYNVDMTRTALRAARLFDGVTTYADPLVLVEDGRITEVRTGPAPADAE